MIQPVIFYVFTHISFYLACNFKSVQRTVTVVTCVILLGTCFFMNTSCWNFDYFFFLVCWCPALNTENSLDCVTGTYMLQTFVIPFITHFAIIVILEFHKIFNVSLSWNQPTECIILCASSIFWLFIFLMFIRFTWMISRVL